MNTRKWEMKSKFNCTAQIKDWKRRKRERGMALIHVDVRVQRVTRRGEKRRGGAYCRREGKAYRHGYILLVLSAEGRGCTGKKHYEDSERRRRSKLSGMC